jgi:hypothetical protein
MCDLYSIFSKFGTLPALRLFMHGRVDATGAYQCLSRTRMIIGAAHQKALRRENT